MNPNTVSATDDRSNAVGDWIARQMLTPEVLQMSPDEYAARHAHEWGCFGLHHYKYEDDALGAWVRRFGEILDSAVELDRCRRQFLTPAEIAEVHRQESEGL